MTSPVAGSRVSNVLPDSASTHSPSMSSFFGARPRSAAAAAASAVIVPSLGQHPASVVSRALAWSPLVWLGRRSYALYLLNLPLTALLLPSFGYGPALLITAGTLSLVAAAASWRYIEAPLAATSRGREIGSASMRAPIAAPPINFASP
jgi:peptidoglycan/LPS O-acetylase OafA/YrhL